MNYYYILNGPINHKDTKNKPKKNNKSIFYYLFYCCKISY